MGKNMRKTCEKCKKEYTQKSGKGSAKAKYCYTCRPLVKKEQQTASSRKSHLKKREQRGSILPNDDQVLFYGYKEPLTKFKGGYGYKGVVTYSKDKERVQCHFCGLLFKNVGSHAKFEHGISAREYKEKTGLALTTALVGESTREAMMTANKEWRNGFSKKAGKEKMKEHFSEMAKKGNKHTKKWSLELRNKKGLCPEQLLDKIRKLAEKLGRRPSAKEYQREYGSFASIMTVYGKWENAVKMAGLTLYSDEKAQRSDRQFLLEHMRYFYKEYGRTPRTSDMKRGLLPPHQTYHSVFGSLNKARLEAGVPLVVQISKYRYEELSLSEAQKRKIVLA